MKTFPYVLVFLLLLGPVFAVERQLVSNESTYSGPYPVAVAVRYEPHPAQPGQYIDVWLTVENRGTENAEGVSVIAYPEFPFSSDSAERIDVGSLAPFTRSQAKFRVRVSERALEGSFPLDFEVVQESRSQTTPVRISVDVRPLDHLLVLTRIEIEPSPVPPGHAFTLKATVTNFGSTPVRSLRSTLALPSTFVPLGESNQKVTPFLSGGESVELVYHLVAIPTAASGPIVLPVNLEFYDTKGTKINQTQNAGVVLGSKPHYSVLVESTTLSRESPSGTVLLKFVNRGLEEIKFLNAKIRSTPDVAVLSGKEFYVGDIESDDFETVEIRLGILDDSKSSIDLPLTLEYTDGRNIPFADGLSVSIPLHSTNDLGRKRSLGYIIVPVLGFMVLLLGVWYFRRQKRRA